MTIATRKALGQFMTPFHVSNLLAEQLPSTAQHFMDLAAGDCSLLNAVKLLRQDANFHGFEIDPAYLAKATLKTPFAKITLANGLTAELPLLPEGSCIVGNPPYTEIEPTVKMQKILNTGFPGLTTKSGKKRAELYFLARSLIAARKYKGHVAILMPAGFSDGDIYRQYRESLMKHYGLTRVIEISPGTFTATEARTCLLVIDASLSETQSVDICHFSGKSKELETAYIGQLSPGDRLDARYHFGKSVIGIDSLSLQDIGVTIVRGKISRKDSERLGINAVHTSDLGKAVSGSLHLINMEISDDQNSIYAEAGDILLPRTGSRVTWKPIVIQSGRQAITDHVFRIRAPKLVKEEVLNAFEHPKFTDWLYSVSKGVCATVLTKRELLTMPLFN